MIIKLVLNGSILDSYPCSEKNFLKCTPVSPDLLLKTNFSSFQSDLSNNS